MRSIPAVLGNALALVALATTVPGVARATASADSTAAPPPVIEIPRQPVVTDTFEVRRAKLTLREIIERSIDGERGKLAGRESMVFTSTVRAVLDFGGRREVVDAVSRTFASADGFERSVELGERTTTYRDEDGTWVVDPDAEAEGEPGAVEVNSGRASDFDDLPLWLEATHEFDYELVDRTVLMGRVIFEIRFRPKSEFKPLPSGTIWIDTDRYRIIHEEFAFEKNPFPLMIRDLERLSRHWTELPTGEWVWTKIRAEVALRSIPFGPIPERMVFAIERTDFALDVPYDPHVFGER